MSEQSGPPPAATPAGTSDGTTTRRVVLQVPRSALLAVVVGVVCTGPLVFAAGLSLLWLLLLPLLAGAWMLRVRTVAGANGFLARSAFRTRAVAWDDVDGVRFPRGAWSWGWGRAVLRDGQEVALPGVGFNDLRSLSLVSGGRVPDPFALAEAARVLAEQEQEQAPPEEETGRQDAEPRPGTT